NATITARTLAREAETIAKSDASPPSHALPRISIDDRDVSERAIDAGRPSRADYAIVSTIGEGGMGRGHLARQRSPEHGVALKTLKPGSPPAVAAALLREARLTGSLEHPGVIPVHALGLDDGGRPMLVMKRVDGVDLATLLADPDHAAWRTRAGENADRLA